MDKTKKLLDIMRQLRDAESGCPWDVEQTFSTIAPYTIEEAYEVADAIDRDDMEGLKDELGDLLLQVVFHAQMAAEQEFFDFEDVAGAISEKMVRRHPHVFGSDAERAAGKQDGSWDEIKASERRADDSSALAGVTRGLPALMRAQKLGKRAGKAGFDWADRRGVLSKVHEELDELEEAVGTRNKSHIDEEFGDLLFAVVNLARHLDVDPEQALSSANGKFERRFRSMEAAIQGQGKSFKDLSMADLDFEWRQAKKRNADN